MAMEERKVPDISLRRLRSSITNGTSLFHGVDERGAWCRRLRDLLAAHLSDLGGEDNVSEAEKVLVRRAAMLTLQLELMEHRFAENEGEASAKQLEVYQRVTGALRRCLESLGLKRRAKPVPTLEEYLRSKERGDVEEAEVAA